MKGAFLVIAVFAFCGGCVLPHAHEPEDRARVAAPNYVGDQSKIAGPFFSRSKVELQRLAVTDRGRAMALLDRGAAGFLVFPPDYDIVLHTDRGPLMDFIKVARIIFVLDGSIVGDFHTMEIEPNQALQPTPTAGTSAAEQPLVPAAVVADL